MKFATILRLMPFDCSISYVPGKLLYTADALSCAPVDVIITGESDTEAMFHVMMSLLPQDADAAFTKVKGILHKRLAK